MEMLRERHVRSHMQGGMMMTKTDFRTPTHQLVENERRQQPTTPPMKVYEKTKTPRFLDIMRPYRMLSRMRGRKHSEEEPKDAKLDAKKIRHCVSSLERSR